MIIDAGPLRIPAMRFAPPSLMYSGYFPLGRFLFQISQTVAMTARAAGYIMVNRVWRHVRRFVTIKLEPLLPRARVLLMRRF
jgi:hypothetical protein